MIRALHPETSKDIEPYIAISPHVGNRRYGDTLYYGSLGTTSFGFSRQFDYMTKVAIAGATMKMPRGSCGIVSPHDSEPYVEVEQISVMSKLGQESCSAYLRTYEIESEETDLIRDLIIPGVARAIYDTVQGVDSPYPQRLSTMTQERLDGMDDLLIRASNSLDGGIAPRYAKF